MLSESDKEAIRSETRGILSTFNATLEKIKTHASPHQSGALRSEEAGVVCDADFRKRMLENALNKTKDCIVAEKAGW